MAYEIRNGYRPTFAREGESEVENSHAQHDHHLLGLIVSLGLENKASAIEREACLLAKNPPSFYQE